MANNRNITQESQEVQKSQKIFDEAAKHCSLLGLEFSATTFPSLDYIQKHKRQLTKTMHSDHHQNDGEVLKQWNSAFDYLKKNYIQIKGAIVILEQSKSSKPTCDTYADKRHLSTEGYSRFFDAMTKASSSSSSSTISSSSTAKVSSSSSSSSSSGNDVASHAQMFISHYNFYCKEAAQAKQPVSAFDKSYLATLNGFIKDMQSMSGAEQAKKMEQAWDSIVTYMGMVARAKNPSRVGQQAWDATMRDMTAIIHERQQASYNMSHGK